MTLPNKLCMAILLFAFTAVSGQEKYWIYLKEKPAVVESRCLVSEVTIAQRNLLQLPELQYSDIPVSPDYVRALEQCGVRVQNCSKWLNAVSAYMTAAQKQQVEGFAFVRRVEKMEHKLYLASVLPEEPANLVLQQLNGYALTQQHLSGKGITIGIIDGKFGGSDKSPALRHIFKDKRVLGYRDFVDKDIRTFFDTGADAMTNAHGTFVWQMIAGMEKNGKVQYGLAPDAQFYIARTDDATREFRKEEDYWIAALEWMDSVGVRLVNTSLGYSTDFNDPAENYSPEQMDGKTAAITIASGIAAREKGMIIVAAAGNVSSEANWSWISAPADAEDVIAVGASDRLLMKQTFSGVGPAHLQYPKPNISCFGEQGTSITAPVITGLVACMLQKDPSLTVDRARNILEKSAHLYPFGNNYIGYGIPDAEKIVRLMNSENVAVHSEEMRCGQQELTISNSGTENAIVFHKLDAVQVITQRIAVSENGLFTIKKVEGARRSTVALKDKVIEVIWEK